MITLRKSAERGHAQHGWLDTYHTFSFADYHDADFMGFGVLRVLNQDRVVPGAGFPTHGHRDMEIVTYVLEGTLEHSDSLGNGSRMTHGDVQLMSAGTGVLHSEFNASREESLHFLQMWVIPARRGTAPRYEQRRFPIESGETPRGGLRLLVSPDGEAGSLTIGQDARLFGGTLAARAPVRHALPQGRSAWLHVARGDLRLGELALGAGDGAAIRDERELVLASDSGAELLLWELPE
jgi:redox-sensitive bicupin YhaK (pirin superfamily)